MKLGYLRKNIYLFLIILICNVFYSIQINAYSDMVYLGGNTIGLQLQDGVHVTGFFDVSTSFGKISPWEFSDLEIGDEIVKIENQEVKCIDDIKRIINTSNENIDVQIKRKNKVINTTLRVVLDNENNKTLGLYMKDSINGIGTLTFVYNNTFASLGHSINNSNVVSLKPIGSIYLSKVIGIRKATNEVVGEKQASFTPTKIGEIYKNTSYGVYGKINSFESEKVNIAKAIDVKKGKALIYTVIAGQKIEQFDCEVVALYNQKHKSIKGIKVKITDERLLENCGGIVQGMSGSPIVQDGKLIGAVSHVVSGNPNFGYGLFAEWMMEELI